MKRLKNIHPGEILKEEFLKPLNISASRLSGDIGDSCIHINEIMEGKRRIQEDTAMRLSCYFNNSPQFWLGLQKDFDIEEKENLSI